MIAWNGLERYSSSRKEKFVIPFNRVMEVEISPREPFGDDITLEIETAQLKCKWVKI